MPFVLIGDSGQRDALTYEEMAREFRGRVKLIIIRQVGGDNEDRNIAVRERAETLRAEGIPLHLVPDGTRAAELCHQAGLCDDETLAQVAAELDPQ
jgi:phosphatidate phosphatase APP1